MRILKIEDLKYDLSSVSVNEENWNLEKWRKEFPMDYLKAIYILNMAKDPKVQATVFKTIYSITRMYIPDILYKYYSLTDNENLNIKKLSTLSDCKIYMSDIKDFNDPYDSKCFFYDPNKLANIDRLKPHNGKIIDDFSCLIKSSSLTANGVQSMPMWAHYSNNHAGFCVSYDMKANTSLSACTFPMQYTKERLDITSLIFEQVNQICSVIDMNSTNGKKVTVIDDLTLILVPLLLSNLKLDQWSYENEFRCTTASNAEGMPYIDAVPKEIFIGMNCSEANKNRLINIAQKLGIAIYQMSINNCGENYELISQ